MGDGKISQPAEKTAAAAGDNGVVNSFRAAALAEEAWRHRPTPYQALENKSHRGIAQAQARPDGTRIGPQGADGAPVFAPVENVPPPAVAPGKAGADPVMPGKDIAAPKGYTYNPLGPSTTADSGTFKPAAYDPARKIGSDQGMELLDRGAKVLGTGIGLAATYRMWEPELAKTFQFTDPGFITAGPTSQIKAGTWMDFRDTRGRAFSYLESNSDAIKSSAAYKKIPKDPTRWTSKQTDLMDKVNAIDEAKNSVSAAREAGSAPLSKVNFSALDPSLKASTYLTDFEKAQQTLILERAKSITDMEARSKKVFDAEKKLAKFGAIKDVSALFLAEGTNLAVDYVMPRNDKSAITAGVDFAAPFVMAAEMSALKGWAPVVKFGVISGSHLISHWMFDKPVDENNPKK